jgi:hypothetical protein
MTVPTTLEKAQAGFCYETILEPAGFTLRKRPMSHCVGNITDFPLAGEDLPWLAAKVVEWLRQYAPEKLAAIAPDFAPVPAPAPVQAAPVQPTSVETPFPIPAAAKESVRERSRTLDR